jgi:DNA repair protein RecN (Recombination protein N)
VSFIVYVDGVIPVQLSNLRIRNLALVEELNWAPGGGFTAVTGETGSGKSIIVGALNLLVGERADKTLIRSGEESCSVEGVFEVRDASLLNPQLQEMGVEPCEDGLLLLKRVLTAAGANRQFINGTATTLAVLKSLGSGLVDLHGPHDHQSLLSPDMQRSLLDAFAGCAGELAAYTGAYRRHAALERELDSLHGDDAAFERECALLLHQSSEIEAAALKLGEEEELHARYTVAAQARRLLELCNQALAGLMDSENAALQQLNAVARGLREIERLDPAAAHLTAAHVRAVTEVEELASDLQRYSESLDLDPSHLQMLEERINLIESLKRKYGGSIEAVLAQGASATERYKKLSSRAEERARLQQELADALSVLMREGLSIRERRTEAAPRLARKITGHLKDLGFLKSEFAVQVLPVPVPAPGGMETVEFLFAPNPGEPSKPLRAIASSGEISRVMLAVKSALAEQDKVPLLVFDEIDANVGGEIAHAVGAKMRALGGTRQVLCISHLPQVASKAHQQFVVSKEYNGERTFSRLEVVSGEQRELEIARMLGGQNASALDLAKSLLASADRASESTPCTEKETAGGGDGAKKRTEKEKTGKENGQTPK